ncbi:MAG: sigma 54-interacting transcriptional regulator, partial [Bacillota bacterium]
GLVGRSSKLSLLLRRARLVASLDCPVLIIGETGTGKDLLARYIHACGPRARSPFEAVNLAAVPETLFESEMFGYAAGSFTGAARGGREGRFQRAGDGTLFLDEVGDMPLSVQAKLLRVLEDRCIEPVGSARKVVFRARVIAATNRDLEQMVAAGTFRADLYYRLAVVTLELPPLRERAGDIPLIAAHVLARLADRYGLPAKQLCAEALAVLQAYPWPGNIRELRNVLEQLFAFAPSPVVTVDDLPPSLVAASRGPRRVCLPPAMAGTDLKSAVRSWEREVILRALEMSGGNKSEAARRLGITRAALYRKLSGCR